MKLAALLFPFFCWAHSVCLFTPPSGWEPSKPKELSKYVRIGFVGKGSGSFRPSIHLAEEAVDCGLEDYLKAVKEIHLSRPNVKWRDLGRIEMRGGTGRLTEIREPSAYGEVVLLQAVLVRDAKAYLLTSAASKDDLPNKRKEILASFSSLDVLPDLWAAIEEPYVRKKVCSFYETLGNGKQTSEWASLQRMIHQETSELGSYWQFLALQEGRSKIYKELK